MPALPRRDLGFAYLRLCRGGDQAWQNFLNKPPLPNIMRRRHGPRTNSRAAKYLDDAPLPFTCEADVAFYLSYQSAAAALPGGIPDRDDAILGDYGWLCADTDTTTYGEIR